MVGSHECGWLNAQRSDGRHAQDSMMMNLAPLAKCQHSIRLG